MTKFLKTVALPAVFVAISALAQTSPAAAGTNSANGLPSAPVPSTAAGTGSRVGTINIEQAIVATNEGRKELEALQKKFEPKQNELKSQNDELESLQKQLQTQGDKLNDDARNNLVQQIQDKKKLFDRAVQDAQEDESNQQNEVAQRILRKMAPIVVKYAQSNGFGLIMDTSKPWPQSPVLWYGQTVDITKEIVDAYNAQSGVSASEPGPVAPKPAGTHPAHTTPKSSTTPKQ